MKIFTWIRNIMTAVAVVILLAALSCLVLRLKPAIVISSSMEPTFHVGSAVFVKEGADFEINDPIAFHNGSMYVTHRLIDIEEENGNTYYITKGDAEGIELTERVLREDIDGKVVLCIPYIGWALKFISSKKGIIVMSALMLCLILSMFMMDEDQPGESHSGSTDSRSPAFIRRKKCVR